MIIHESKILPYLLCIFLFLSIPAFCQNLRPAPDFLFLDAGYGATALGMGGAFTAVAEDLSAIYWNPAGVAQLPQVQFSADYLYLGDTDEDFGAEAQPNSFDSAQRFAVSGSRFQSFAASYSFATRNHTFVPMFAWQRPRFLSPKRSLKEPAGMVDFLTSANFVQSEGTFDERVKGGQDELSFGLASAVSPNIFIGGTWSFLYGNPKTVLTGSFHDTFNNANGTLRQDITLDQTREDDLHGNYLKVGLLFFPNRPFSFGGTVQFPYKQRADVTLTRNATVVSEQGSQTVTQTATAKSSLEVPMEFSAGIAMRHVRSFTLSGSLTYANWDGQNLVISGSSDADLLPETALPYPALRAGAQPSGSLMQLRAGTEYLIGNMGNGLMLRSGIFRDGQPYRDKNGERVWFKGYTFGLGYAVSGFRFDAAYVREKGEIFFDEFSSGESSFSHRRFVFTLTLSTR